MNRLTLFTGTFLLSQTFTSFCWANQTADLANKIVVEGTADDSVSKIALRKLTHKAILDGEVARVKHAKSLIAVLETKKEYEIKAFILRELMFAGREESVKSISEYLADKKLCEDASRALIGIFQQTKSKEIQTVIAAAFAKASGANALTLGKACGSLRISDKATLEKLKKMATDKNWTTRQCGLQGLASIGVKGCESFFTDSIKNSKTSNRAFSLDLSFLYARRLAETDKTAALALCKSITPQLQDQKDAPFLVNCLATALQIDNGTIDDVLKYLEHPNPRISNSLSRILQRMKSETVNKRLLTTLESGSTKAKSSALSILFKNAPALATPYIVKFLSSDEEALKSVALMAATQLDAAEAAPFLLKTLLSGNEADKDLARSTFSQLQINKKATEKICAAYKKEASVENKKAIIALLADNNVKGAMPTIIAAMHEGDADLRKDAIKALKTTSRVEDAEALLKLLAKVESKEVRYLQYALVSAFRGEQIAPQIELLIPAAAKLKDKYQTAVFGTLASIDSQNSIEALRPYAMGKNEEIQKAAIKALAGSPSILAADILATACGQGGKTSRILAARGLMQLIGSIEGENLLKKRALQKAYPKVENTMEKQQIKKALGSIHAINNLALGKKVTTKGKGSKLELITDGEISKKAAAGISGKDTSFQIDLGKIEPIVAVNLTFIFDGKSHYGYDIEFSADGKTWKKLVSSPTPKKATEAGFVHHFPTQKSRYFRVCNIACKRGKKVSKSIRVVELGIYPQGEAPLQTAKK
jgi:HEAT repeat protein